MAYSSIRAPRRSQGGFISYVLAVCVLLAAVTALSIRMARVNTMGNYIFETTNAVYSAGVLIQTKIRYCPLAYPAGDNGTTFAPQYPGATVAVAVDTLVCPGRAAVTLFTGGDGIFLPVTPKGFGAGWTYLNTATGVRITLTSDGAAARNKVLAQVASKLSTSATYSAGVLTLWIKK